MKIGILTLPLHTNYGGILQAYALQTVLERMGHDVCLIEKKRQPLRLPLWKAPLSYGKRIVKNLTGHPYPIFFERKVNREEPLVRQNTDKFVNKYIKRRFVDDFSEIGKDDFDAITSSANGTKKASENKTGYKGIGFKSVFTDSEMVLMKTGGYQFKFDKSDPRFMDFERFYFFVNGYETDQQKNEFLQKFSGERSRFQGVSDIPWQLEPIWVDGFPEELGDDFTKSNVAIALKLGKSKILGDNGYDKAIADIILNPRFMLFLRNTKRIDFNGLSVSKTIEDGRITLKNSFGVKRIEYFKRKDFEVEVSNDVFEKNGIDVRIDIEEQDEVSGKIIEAKFVDTHNQEIENIPKKIAINNSSVISFAIPIDEIGALRPNTKYNEISLFAFLPTLVKDFKFAFYINANFILDPPRQRILGDNPWNFYLMQEIARCLVHWCALLNESKDKNALNILLPKSFDEDTADTRQLAKYFNTAYKSALESEAFILNHKSELAKQDEIIIDKTGLSAIVGADLFCQLLDTEKCLPSDKIDSKILEEDIFEYIELLKFDDVIKVITNNSDFSEWLISAKDEQKEALYKWIDENNIQTCCDDLRLFVSHLPLFQFGSEYKSREEIDDSIYIIVTEHIMPIKEILSKLGFICSGNLFVENHPLYKFVDLQDEGDLFGSVKESDFSGLTTDERRVLFFALAEFSGVGEAKLKDIALFRNLNGAAKPLGEMVAYRDDAPLWFSDYVLCKDDNDVELSDYLIPQKDEFSIVQKHIDDIDAPLAELYAIYKDEWPGQFTRHLIEDNYVIDDELQTIIENSDRQTQKCFLNSIEKLELHSASFYKKNSYEYRVLQLALSVYEEPSDFSSKVYFDGRCIKDFSVSDEVVCDFCQKEETKKVKMSLAKLLPQYQNQSDSIEKIKSLFENKKGLDKFFAAKSKSVDEVHRELNQYLGIPEGEFPVWNVDGNAHQYLFAVYYRRNKKHWYDSWCPAIDLDEETEEFVGELMEFLFVNEILISESPFTYHLKNYFTDKYFDSDYILESERVLPTIEQWANDDKKRKYLKDNGVQTEICNTLQFRKFFLEDKPIGFIDKLADDELASSVEFIAYCEGYDRPFAGVNQKAALLQLKDKKKCGMLDSWDGKKMEERAAEWDSKEYKKWSEYYYPHIFIYPGILPRQLSYENELLLNYDDEKSAYYYDKQGKKLFVSNARNLEDILFEVAKEAGTDFCLDDYKELCLDGKISVSKEDIEKKDRAIESLEKSNREKAEIIEQYRAIYGDLPRGNNFHIESNTIENTYFGTQTEIELQKGKLIKRDALSREEQIAAHKEAENVIKERLENDGYDCSNWVLDGDSDDRYQKWCSINQIENIVSPEGEKVNLVVKSAKSGYIYLSATDFEFLTSDSSNILMIWDGKNVHSVTAEDIFNKESNVNLIFDTEYTPKHYYAALSKVFQYIKRTTFAVKNPSYNSYDSIKSFGMDSKTEGIQELFDDNDL